MADLFRDETEFNYISLTATWLEKYGVLPEPGGLLEQPKRWKKMVELYLAMKAQVQDEWAEHVKREQEAKATHGF